MGVGNLDFSVLSLDGQLHPVIVGGGCPRREELTEESIGVNAGGLLVAAMVASGHSDSLPGSL